MGGGTQFTEQSITPTVISFVVTHTVGGPLQGQGFLSTSKTGHGILVSDDPIASLCIYGIAYQVRECSEGSPQEQLGIMSWLYKMKPFIASIER